jgi:hypothetical protein
MLILAIIISALSLPVASWVLFANLSLSKRIKRLEVGN